jgi:hypothetical protein
MTNPSRITLLSVCFTVAVHLALFIAVWTTPAEAGERRHVYDHLSSAVFEVFGPAGVVYLYDVSWPGTGEAGSLDCGDPESALDGLRNAERPWCR